MVMADEKGKRPRTRAPVLCLNCKRRKVRCDKGRPCGGCVRNNVGHLCVYVDPKWADSLKKVAENGGLEMAPGVTQQDTLRMDLERQIEAQNREIQCLRARLAHANSTGENSGMAVGIRQNQNVINGNGTSSPPSSANKTDHSLLELMREMSHKKVPMTILAKLSGRPSQPKPIVSQDALFSINGFRGGGTGIVSESAEIAPTTIYSWLNIVKVDPQLTALWFRITSLQKTYHMYKTTLLKNGNKLGQHKSLSLGSSVKPKTENSNMSTNSEDPTNTDHKCPVVAYEFNLMLEESPSPGPQEKPVCPMKIETLSSPTGPIHGATRGEDALEILGAIQGLWAEILGGSLATTHELTYTQIEDLVEKYMVGSMKVDSRHILRFFRAEICGLFSQNGTKPRLEVGSFSLHMSDAEVLDLLRLKAVYMAMLAVVIEETRSGANSGTDPRSSSSGIYFRILGLVHLIFRSNTRVVSENSLLAALSLFACVLNRLTAIYDASPSSSLEIDVRNAYTGVFVLLFETLFQDSGKGQLQIWCDPAHVSVDDDAIPQTELGVLLCGLWADTLRHANIAVLGFVPILRHGTQIDRLLGQLLDKVPIVAASQTHVAYLASNLVKSLGPHVKTVLFNIQTQYLVCRATSLLRNGIGGDIFERRVALADFLRMATEMAEWQKTCANSEFGSCPIRAFEATLMLKYGFLFFTAVAFLQCEENGDCDLVALILPGLFDAYIELTRFLQASSVQFAQIHGSRYVWAAVGETLARISHLVAGLLIRFKPDSTSLSTLVLVYTPKHAKTPKLISIPVARKEALLREGDRTVEIFESTMGPKLARSRTKIWKFYQTFLRNSHKATPPAYVQAHADALGAGRFLDRCPIMAGSNYETSAARMEVGKCPVFHGDMGKPVLGLGPGSRPSSVSNSVSNSAPRVSGCPVSGMSDMGTLLAPRGLKPDPDLKRCPYGHGLLDNVEPVEPSRKRRWPYNDSTDPRIEDSPRRDSQNLLMGRLSKYTPPLCVPMASPIPPPLVMPAPPIVAPSIPTPVPVNDTFSLAPFVDMDWDSLPNFNFDVMEDEALMGQLNSGDFNNPLIEGLFQ